MQTAALTAVQSAAYLNISERRLHQLRADPDFPKARVVGGDKQKDADEFAPIGFRARKVTHGEIESLVLDHADGARPTMDRLKPNEVAILATLKAAFPGSVMRAEFKRNDGSPIPESTFDRDIKRLIAVGYVARLGQGEYVLAKSPSPNTIPRIPTGDLLHPRQIPTIPTTL